MPKYLKSEKDRHITIALSCHPDDKRYLEQKDLDKKRASLSHGLKQVLVELKAIEKTLGK